MRINIGQASISAMGSFSDTAASAMLRIEGRKTWKRHDWLLVEKTGHNLGVLRELFPEAIVTDLCPAPPLPAGPDPEPQWVMEPRSFQRANFERFKNKSQFAIFSDPGTGKTKVAIDIMCHRALKGTVTGVIVLSSPKGVHAQWIRDQLPKHCWPNVPTRTHIWDGKNPDWMNGQLNDNKLEIISGNIDMVRGKGFQLLEAFARQHGTKLLFLIDESDSIKSRTTQRSMRVRQLAQYTNQRAIMTGTPIAKDLTDEWAQFYFLDPDIIGHKYATSFRAQYCIMGGYENRQVVGHKNLEAFKRITAPHIFRATKDELDLPPKIYDEVVFDLTDEQKRIMRDIKDKFYADLSAGTLSVSNGAVALMRMQQVSNGFAINEEGKPVPLENPRLDVLKKLRSEIHGKTIIWCRFVHDVTYLLGHFPGAVGIIGEQSLANRSLAKDAFIDGKATELIATSASIGRGTDGLQYACANAIYYSNSFSAIDRWQSEDRIDRIGQTKSCSYFDLIARGSPDRGILRNLRNKKAISELAIDGLKELMDEIE